MAYLDSNDPNQQQWNSSDAGLGIGGFLGMAAFIGGGAAALLYRRKVSAGAINTHKASASTMPSSAIAGALSNLQSKGLTRPIRPDWQISNVETGRYSVQGLAGAIANRMDYTKTRYVEEALGRQQAMGSLVSRLASQTAEFLPQPYKFSYLSDMPASTLPWWNTSNLLQKTLQRGIGHKFAAYDIETSRLGSRDLLREFSIGYFDPFSLAGKSSAEITGAIKTAPGFMHGLVLNESLMSTMRRFHNIHESLGRQSLSDIEKRNILRRFSQQELFNLGTISGLKGTIGNLSFAPSKFLTKQAFSKRRSNDATEWAKVYQEIVEGSVLTRELYAKLGKSKQGSVKLGKGFYAMTEASATRYLKSFANVLASEKGPTLIGQYLSGIDIKMLGASTLQESKILKNTIDLQALAEMEMAQGAEHMKSLGFGMIFSKTQKAQLEALGVKGTGRSHEAFSDVVDAAAIFTKQIQANKALNTHWEHGYVTKDSLLVATASQNIFKAAQKRTGISSIDKAIDDFFVTKGNIYKISSIKGFQEGGRKFSLVEFANLGLAGEKLQEASLKKTRSTYGIFEEGGLQDLLTKGFDILNPVTEKLDVEEAKLLSTNRGRQAAIDTIAKALGVTELSASNRRIGLLKRLNEADIAGTMDKLLAEGIKTGEIPPGAVHHYAKTASYMSTIREFMGTTFQGYEDIMSKLAGMGKNPEEIETILGLTHKELGLTVGTMFAKESIPATGYTRSMPLPEQWLTKRGIKGLTSIRVTDLQTTTGDINRLLGQLRGSVEREETGMTLMRDLLGIDSTDKLNKLALKNNVIRRNSPLGKILLQLHNGHNILTEINANHSAIFAALKTDTTNAGQMLAYALLNSEELFKSKTLQTTQTFAPQLARPELMQEISQKALTLGKQIKSINSADDLFAVISQHMQKAEIASPAVPIGLQKVTTFTNPQAKKFTQDVWNTYQALKTGVSTDEGKVMLRVIDEGKQIQMGIMPTANSEISAAFWRGESTFKGRYGEEAINMLSIPVPTGDTISWGDRKFYNKTFLGEPEGFAMTPGMAAGREQVTLAGQQYYKFTAGELAMMGYGTTDFTTKMKNLSKTSWGYMGKIRQLETEGQFEEAENVRMLLRQNNEQIQSAINHVRNSVIELLAPTADSDWIMQTANLQTHDFPHGIQTGTLRDLLTSSRVHIAKELAPPDKARYLSNLIGTNAIGGIQATLAPIFKEVTESVMYTRPQYLGKGELAGYDVSALTPFGRYMNPLSPRPTQALNQLMLSIAGPEEKAAPLGITQTMKEVLTAGKERLGATMFKYHSAPVIGAEVQVSANRSLQQIIKEGAGVTLPGVTIEEGAAVVKASLAARIMGVRQTEKTVAQQIARSLYSKGSIIEHGTVLGVDELGHNIVYQHPLHMKSTEIRDYLHAMGIKAPRQLATEIMSVEQLPGGKMKYQLAEYAPLLSGTSMHVEGTKLTAQVINDSHFAMLQKALNLPGNVEVLMSTREYARGSRLHLGSIMTEHAKLATALRRDIGIREEVAKTIGISSEEVLRQAELVHTKLGVKYSPMETIIPTELHGITGNMSREQATQYASGILKDIESLPITKYRATAGGDIIKLFGADIRMSDELFFARMQGLNKNPFWEGASMGWREIEMALVAGRKEYAMELLKDLDENKKQLAISTIKATSSLVGPLSGETAIAMSMEPIKKISGGAYQETGTLLEQLGTTGAYFKLPFKGALDIGAKTSGEAGAYHKMTTLENIYLPAINAYHDIEGVRDKYIGMLSKLPGIRSSDDMTKWLKGWAGMLHEDVIGKSSVLAGLSRGTTDMSAVLRAAPIGGAAETAEVILHPSTIKKILGEGGMAIYQKFEEAQKPFLLNLHRFPTTSTASTGVVQLRASEYAAPWLGYTSATNWGLSEGDFDADLSILLAKLGVGDAKVKDMHNRVQAEHRKVAEIRNEINKLEAKDPRLTTLRTDLSEAVTERTRVINTMAEEAFNSITSNTNELYKEDFKAWQNRNQLIQQYNKSMQEGYITKANMNEALEAVNKGNASSLLTSTDTAINKAINQGYFALTHGMMNDAERLAYWENIAERSMGTKALTGIVSNLADSMKQMAYMTYGTQPGEMARDLAMTFNFAGAVYHSATATKSAELPYKIFTNVMKASEFSKANELKQNFIKQLSEANMLEGFQETIGKSMAFEGKTAQGVGSEAIDAAFTMLHRFSQQYSKDILGHEGFVSPMAFKETPAMQQLLGFKGAGEKMTIEMVEQLARTGGPGGSVMNAIIQSLTTTAGLSTSTEGVSRNIGNVVAEQVSLAKLPNINRGAAIGAVAALAAISAPFIIGAAIQGSPQAPEKHSPPPIQQPGHYDKIGGSPQATYETTYVDVKAHSKRPTRDLDRLTMMALQNSMQVKLDGSISINDNRRPIDDIVSNSLSRII